MNLVKDFENSTSALQTVFDARIDRRCIHWEFLQLTAEDLHLRRCDETKRDSVALDFYNFDNDVAADDQLLTNFPT